MIMNLNSISAFYLCHCAYFYLIFEKNWAAR
jgi:hypothetical protein